MKCTIQTLVVLTAYILIQPVNAAWVGPVDVLSGGWGSGGTEFGVEYGDTEDLFPSLTDISSLGKIAISDELNGRIKIYEVDGTLIRNIIPPVADPKNWTLKPKFIGQNIVIPIQNYYFYSNTGVLLAQPASSPGRPVFTGELNGNLYEANEDPNQWVVYSPAGVLLNTYTEKPHELGRMSKHIFRFQGKKAYRITLSYPDKEWNIISHVGACNEYDYIRDNAGHLYCVGSQSAVRYSACGKVVSTFHMPKDVTTQVDLGPGVEP